MRTAPISVFCLVFTNNMNRSGFLVLPPGIRLILNLFLNIAFSMKSVSTTKVYHNMPPPLWPKEQFEIIIFMSNTRHTLKTE